VAITAESCPIEGCDGEMHPLQNLYRHTLGGDANRADFGEFIECSVKRCARCGNLTLSARERPIRAG
jgi:hypothetical protein